MRTDLRLIDNERREWDAADWVMRISEQDLSQEELAQWLAWCDETPANGDAFEAMARVWEVSGQIDRDRVAAYTALRGEQASVSKQRSWGWQLWGSLAASLALVLGLGGVLLGGLFDAREEMAVARFETQRGQVRSARLDDGSRIDLGGRSTMAVRYTPQSRLVIAEKGEAFFEVAKNHDRPFIVQAGPLTITAVGTAFSVQRDGNAVAVLVTEGVVEVRAQSSHGGSSVPVEPTVLRIAAGQSLRFDRNELVKTVEADIPNPVERWREGRLEFRNEPLRLVVARINRYSPTQIEVGDPAIEDLRVTATVYDDQVKGWLNGIEAVLPVDVRYSIDGKAIISSATARGN